MSLLTYQSLPCDVSNRLTAMVFAPLEHANFVPATNKARNARYHDSIFAKKNMQPSLPHNSTRSHDSKFDE